MERELHEIDGGGRADGLGCARCKKARVWGLRIGYAVCLVSVESDRGCVKAVWTDG